MPMNTLSIIPICNTIVKYMNKMVIRRMRDALGRQNTGHRAGRSTVRRARGLWLVAGTIAGESYRQRRHAVAGTIQHVIAIEGGQEGVLRWLAAVTE
jgi:hypothetical protein